MQHRDNVALPASECRLYWREGYITDPEWWRAGQLLLETPQDAEAAVLSDYCEAHRTRIYPDLGCQYCHERPRRARNGPTLPHRPAARLSSHV